MQSGGKDGKADDFTLMLQNKAYKWSSPTHRSPLGGGGQG
jgi:hypothetical protein